MMGTLDRAVFPLLRRQSKTGRRVSLQECAAAARRAGVRRDLVILLVRHELPVVIKGRIHPQYFWDISDGNCGGVRRGDRETLRLLPLVAAAYELAEIPELEGQCMKGGLDTGRYLCQLSEAPAFGVANMFLFVGLLVSTLLFAGCRESVTTPTPQQIPEPVVVSWETLPVAFNDQTYFRNGLWDARPDSILLELIENNFRLKNAWYAYGGRCAEIPVVIKALIVELTQADQRIEEYGFSADDPPPVGPVCYSEFLYYAFTP